MKIYTRTGDKGKTSLFGGQRVSKSDKRVEAYGEVDELNSAIGLVMAGSQKSPLRSAKQNFAGQAKLKIVILNLIQDLEHVQNDLFLIGSTLANPQNPRLPELKKRVEKFERLIDDMTSELPELNNFILPGGGLAGAQLHVCRTICRRVERKVVALSQTEDVDDNVRMYFNRLSDLLFTMARYMNHLEKQPEVIWSKR